MKTIICLTALSLLTACNTPPSRITPDYSNVKITSDCARAEKELRRVDATLSTQRNQLETDANIDRGIVAGSIALMPIALVSLAFTGNKELQAEYARNLAKQETLQDLLSTCN